MEAKIEILRDKVADDAIAFAKELLARCESGQTVALTVVEERRGGDYAISGSKVKDRHRTAGMLLDAAIVRLDICQEGHP